MKQVPHVLAGRWQVVQERVVVSLIEVRALFERSDQRPQERTGTDECGSNGGEVQPHTSQPVTADCAAPKAVDPLIGADCIDGRHVTAPPFDAPPEE